VQEDSNAAGLHHFKLKVGFEALPVHRAFVPHPLLRPLVGQASLEAMRFLLRRQPGNRWLKKASGVMASVVEGKSVLPAGPSK
jgi:hypothetical protein